MEERRVYEWWLTLVQPYVPSKKPYWSPSIKHMIGKVLQRMEPDVIRETFAELPRLRGATHARGFNIVELFRPRKGAPCRIELVASGRYASWLRPVVHDRKTTDISEVLRGDKQPEDWLQVPLLDRHGVYQVGRLHSAHYTDLMSCFAPWDLRFVRDFIMPRADSDAFFARHMRGLLDSYRADPGRWT